MTSTPSTSTPDQPSFLELCPQQGWEVLSTRGQSLPGLVRRYSHSEGTAESGHRRIDSSQLEDGITTGTGQESASSLFDERPHMQRRGSILIGDTKSPFRWSEYHTPPVQLAKLRKPVRLYYERMNYLVSRYSYVDRLLDSSIARDLLEDYERHWARNQSYLHTITEEQSGHTASNSPSGSGSDRARRHLTERTPLLSTTDDDDNTDSFHPRTIVMMAIYINLVANCILLAAKIAVTVMTSSVSVLASLVDAALDFLSTAIIWSTTRLTVRQDKHRYPVGRQRLEPVGVLIFSVVMITSFFQVSILSLQQLTGNDHSTVELTVPAITIMASTVVVKGLCWLWCRRINDSNVQALAQDAMTDIVFNIFSIIFPLIGSFANLWFLDPLGGLLLSLYVIGNWAGTAREHIAHLTGAAASPGDRSVLLYLVMRFATCIRWIQNLEVYHSGDRLTVEVDIVLDESISLHDSHDIGESLQHMLENVGSVDRAFVHLDYAEYNLPTHVDNVGR